MDVEIISKECIKPSSTTPSHLKTYKASLLDQFMPPIYYSTSFFYPNTNSDLNISQRSFLLKHSLSKTLSHFHPLAGKIKDYVSIDCNDEGAYYTEARANIAMVEYLTKPDLSVLNKLVPDVSSLNQNPIGAFIVLIQETTFACGGLAIGISVSHMALDGTALASFVKAWASAASSSRKDITNPNLDSSSVFPQCDSLPKEATFFSAWSPFIKKGKVAVRRLVLDASAINKLKSIAASSSIKNPTRVEVVSAIISKSLKETAFNDAPIGISHGVNMRRKATPLFPDSSLGNFLWLAPAVFKEKESQVSELVYKIRKAIRKIDSDFVAKVGHLKLLKELKEIQNELSQGEELVNLTSWCNFGLYDGSDFGWGKPIWIAPSTMVESQEIAFNKTSIFMDTRSGNGVEAWVYLPQDIAAFVDKDDNLLQYVSVDPSPLTHH